MSDDSPSRRLVAAFEPWLRAQTVEALLPPAELSALVAEGRADAAGWERLRPKAERLWQEVHAQLRQETRPLGELMAPELRERILAACEALEPDPEAVRTFLRSPAIEAMLGTILYTGISEFLRRADLLGRLLNRLPVIGPIRKKVTAIFREEVENRLESQIKSFLGGFSGKAVERMIQFVLSEENRPGFRVAQRRLGEYLLSRPLNALLPTEPDAARGWQTVSEALRDDRLQPQEDELIARLHAAFGEDPAGEWLWSLSQRSSALFVGVLERFFADAAGHQWLESAQPEPRAS